MTYVSLHIRVCNPGCAPPSHPPQFHTPRHRYLARESTLMASLHLLPHHQLSWLPLLTSRVELPSLLVSLYKHWLFSLQKQATVLGWRTENKPVLVSLARISRVHGSGDAGVHCKLPFSVQRKRALSVCRVLCSRLSAFNSPDGCRCASPTTPSLSLNLECHQASF